MKNRVCTVSNAQAAICGDFLLDAEFNGEGYTLPLHVAFALDKYKAFAGEKQAAELAIEIESWLDLHRDACVALLGPGLDIEQ